MHRHTSPEKTPRDSNPPDAVVSVRIYAARGYASEGCAGLYTEHSCNEQHEWFKKTKQKKQKTKKKNPPVLREFHWCIHEAGGQSWLRSWPADWLLRTQLTHSKKSIYMYNNNKTLSWFTPHAPIAVTLTDRNYDIYLKTEHGTYLVYSWQDVLRLGVLVKPLTHGSQLLLQVRLTALGQ